jgi:SAM-dependent methyltransferase
VENLTEHWNKAYDKSETTNLGWYEETPAKSLELITKTNLSKDARILNVGVGASTLIDYLVNEGYTNLIANDLSQSSLTQLQARLGENANDIEWIVDDLINPTNLQNLEPIDLWCDRAVVHFFNKEDEQKRYFDLVKKLVKKGGFVKIATFNLDGATQCCGLPVHRYDADMLADRLGNDFELIETFNYTYINPSNSAREYVYTLFRRK